MTTDSAILDAAGRVMFRCSHCGEPMRSDDFFEQGLRMPERGELAGDYCDEELIDQFEHLPCLRAAARTAS